MHPASGVLEELFVYLLVFLFFLSESLPSSFFLPLTCTPPPESLKNCLSISWSLVPVLAPASLLSSATLDSSEAQTLLSSLGCMWKVLCSLPGGAEQWRSLPLT